MDKQVYEMAEQLGRLLMSKEGRIATAESCTGGGIAQIITEVPGSSTWFDRGFVSYSNKAKEQMLGVKPETLKKYGAVSAETAHEMVTGALAHSEATCAIAVTGIAGPGGGTAEKPVGTVFIAWAWKNGDIKIVKKQLAGSRHEIRAQTMEIAIKEML